MKESIITFFSEVFKQEITLSRDIKLLAESINNISSEITKISQLVVSLTKLMNEHSQAIEQIVSVQEYILGTMKDDMLDPLDPVINKEKLDKPN